MDLLPFKIVIFMEGGGVGFPTLWFRHILGSSWVSLLYEERAFYYYLQFGNYCCWDNGEVQFTQYDSRKIFFEIHICQLTPLRRGSGPG